ncbi:uncharacterized protein F5Z01DRAFT_642254 [Emericellopsis atlantica]|uniref:Tafazzin n=1 Tax=Emericellopsis atlantica TaxID=2614577 RepID=A0A9P7ZVG2_9HYPO|nr:uncharacterized protein F5Z01DRAFT_642254 [Emericellopsis atlantica]KAG9259074.1 hypothetical protein F5Z01DRAFT_642254 [Emericellopsis atlantica]
MPKKRQYQHLKSFKPTVPVSPALSSSSSRGSDAPAKGVNELLSGLRREAAGPSSAASPHLLANGPSLHPDLRSILQIPDTPPPAPRRPVRTRFDASGRRLPAGPPPPRSWVATRGQDVDLSHRMRGLKLKDAPSDHNALPGAYLPGRGSLIDRVLRAIASDWEFQRVYQQYHLYFLPNHLKPALLRHIGISDGGVTLADLKLILLPPADLYEQGELEEDSHTTNEITYLDLSRSLGRSIRLRDVTNLLFPPAPQVHDNDLEDSWDAAVDATPSPPRALLPNLTHLSLALSPHNTEGGSWRHLLDFAFKTSHITHLSLAYWPDPCLAPRAQTSKVTTPQGNKIYYGGTNFYSHSLDHDWSEALLVLRKLSRRFYELEYLDLTGCGSWFKALMLETEHDHVDWAVHWGKVTVLRLYAGFPGREDMVAAEQVAFAEVMETAALVERHIRHMRAGKGRFINVERDRPAS